MIFETLQIVKEEVNNFLEDKSVSLSNIAISNSETSSSEGSTEISLTLVNIQEEFALKNSTNNYVTGNTVTYKNPRVHLNLYALFSIDKSTYAESLKSLTDIISFFQGKRVFTQDNTNFDGVDGLSNVKNFRFIVELYTPSFEELNHIWGVLGGKQYPSVLYKITLVSIERDVVNKQGTIISSIENNVIKKN